jgi:hypothetical protein
MAGCGDVSESPDLALCDSCYLKFSKLLKTYVSLSDLTATVIYNKLDRGIGWVAQELSEREPKLRLEKTVSKSVSQMRLEGEASCLRSVSLTSAHRAVLTQAGVVLRRANRPSSKGHAKSKARYSARKYSGPAGNIIAGCNASHHVKRGICS